MRISVIPKSFFVGQRDNPRRGVCDPRRSGAFANVGAEPARALLNIAVLLSLCGCVSIGPNTIEPDIVDYGIAISRAAQREMLLNIIRLRYGEPPSFLQVTSVINQYNIEGRLEVTGEWPRGGEVEPTVKGTGSYYDRPTITYVPLYGEEFLNTVITPVFPSGILLLSQAGMPADVVLSCGVDSINNLRNRPNVALSRTDDRADPGFVRLLELFAEMQGHGFSPVRFEKTKDTPVAVLTIPLGVEGEFSEQFREARELLGLDPEITDFTLVYGSAKRAKEEIAIRTRSVLGMLTFVSRTVSIPEEPEPSTIHASREGHEPQPVTAPYMTPMKVRHSRRAPADSAVAVKYRGYWFYVEENDSRSKAALTFLLYATSLAKGGAKGIAPVITVSTGG